MKSKNCEYSKLGDIVTPLRFPELFFDDVLVDMIVIQTKLHSHREKVDITFEITNETVPLFLSMNMLKNKNATAQWVS